MLARSKKIIIISWSFVLGVTLASLNLEFIFLFWASVLIMALILLLPKKFLWLMIVILFLVFGFLWTKYSWPEHLVLSQYFEQKVTLIGQISGEPDFRPDKSIYELKVLCLQKNNFCQKINEKVLIYSTIMPRYSYGQEVQVSCRLTDPKTLATTYATRLAVENIYATCLQAKIKLLKPETKWSVTYWLFQIRQSLTTLAQKALPEPESSFLAGLLWGDRAGLPEEIKNNFKCTGLSHIVAVSGYNVTIVVTLLAGFISQLSLNKKVRLILSLMGIIFFVILCGASASIVRAGVMTMVVLLARYFQRLTSMGLVLSQSLVILLIINPKLLLFDPGFQLSYLATLGLVYIAPIIEKVFQKLPNVFQIKETLVTTLSAMIATTPIMLYTFGNFSLIAPLANILILPSLPLNMFLGSLAMISSLISWKINILAQISYAGLNYVLKTVERLANIPGVAKSSWYVGIYPMLGIYLAMVLLVWFYYHQKDA